ncbi:hypothetical protein LTS08_007018 [Lithohypha guttulata]|uniref:uncharacterized protein n=1 Tax=Lithohypha guttulata TaxID=1690604 RepID=UPI002DE17D4E|nr:hypothetical protein LTR51_002068 [Lithohypha guttulata]KAK5097603.1 hypothetical protein LTS08_007018 [Lithohypha guttulata]
MQGAHYIHPYARSRLYDLRKYKLSNFWGPFMDDGSGRIDWEKVQNIYIVLGYGLRMLIERTGSEIGGSVTWGMGLNGGSDHEMWQGLASGSFPSKTETTNKKDDDAQSSAATAGSTIDGSDEGHDGVPTLEWFEEHYQDRKEALFQHEQAVFATQDPYGVKGVWMRIVNFLDYHDLFAFNFSNPQIPDHRERDPVQTDEAYRLILLKLWVTRIEWPDEEEDQAEEWETVAGSEPSSPAATRTCEDPDPMTENTMNSTEETAESASTPTATPAAPKRKSRYPIVYFEGRSRSLHVRWDPNANSHIRGQVRAYPAPAIPKHELDVDDPIASSSNLNHIYLNQAQQNRTPSYSTAEKISSETVTGLKPEDDLVIRWTTWSVFGGEERWRSEGVQIGGLKSARGILGNWFDKDFDRHGPCGPTGFWKMSDDVQRYGQGAGVRRIWGDDDD